MALLEIGATILGGVLNAAGNSAEREAMEKQRQKALAFLEENLVDQNEINSILANINKVFNTRLTNTLNSTALRSRGIANANVVKGAVAGGIEGQRYESLLNTKLNIMESNRQTRAQMSGIESSMVSQGSFLGDFIGGAAATFPAVNELSRMFGRDNDNGITAGLGIGVGQSAPSSNAMGLGKGLSINGPSYNQGNMMEGLSTFSKLFQFGG